MILYATQATQATLGDRREPKGGGINEGGVYLCDFALQLQQIPGDGRLAQTTSICDPGRSVPAARATAGASGPEDSQMEPNMQPMGARTDE